MNRIHTISPEKLAVRNRAMERVIAGQPVNHSDLFPDPDPTDGPESFIATSVRVLGDTDRTKSTSTGRFEKDRKPNYRLRQAVAALALFSATIGVGIAGTKAFESITKAGDTEAACSVGINSSGTVFGTLDEIHTGNGNVNLNEDVFNTLRIPSNSDVNPANTYQGQPLDIAKADCKAAVKKGIETQPLGS